MRPLRLNIRSGLCRASRPAERTRIRVAGCPCLFGHAFNHCFWGSPFMNARTSNISYRGEKGKTTGYYVPKGAEEATREGVAAWQKLQECLRELAELNKDRNLGHAREAESRRSDG